MATIKAKLKKMAETPEAAAADRVWQQIEQKLNYDGRYSLLNPVESMLRIGRLTNQESEYLGRVMGWDVPFYKGIDFENVPTPFLAECLMLPEKRIMNTLCAVHPSPERKPVIEAAEKDAESGNYEAFLAGDISFDDLVKIYPQEVSP
jgi:hypothetical protein